MCHQYIVSNDFFLQEGREADICRTCEAICSLIQKQTFRSTLTWVADIGSAGGIADIRGDATSKKADIRRCQWQTNPWQEHELTGSIGYFEP